MSVRRKKKLRSTLTKAQTRLLRQSIIKLLGEGLLDNSAQKESAVGHLLLKDALNARLLGN